MEQQQNSAVTLAAKVKSEIAARAKELQAIKQQQVKSGATVNK